MWAIIDYGLDGVEPEEDGLYLVAYDMAKPQVDANIERKANGYRGGRPIKENTEVKELTQEEKVSSQEPVAGSFPLNDGSRYDVTETALAELQRLYPGVDAKQELNKIIGWCEAIKNTGRPGQGLNDF